MEWEKRFRNISDMNEKYDDRIIRPIQLYVKDLELVHWDVSAIDFHCNHKLIDFIMKKYDDLSEEEIKKMIWYNSSSINKRYKDQMKYNYERWKEMEEYVKKTQKYLLETGY